MSGQLNSIAEIFCSHCSIRVYIFLFLNPGNAVYHWSTCLSGSVAWSTPSSPRTLTEQSPWLLWLSTAVDQSYAVDCACCCRKPVVSHFLTLWRTATGSYSPTNPPWMRSGGQSEFWSFWWQ